jgi:lysophospholipase L1-like esterase
LLRLSRGVLRAAILCLAAVSVAACDRGPTTPSPPGDPMTPTPPAPPAPEPAPAPILGVERVLAFGNSITEGESTGLGFRLHDPATPGIPTSYPFKLQELIDGRYTDQDIHVFNGGRGGERATEAMDRLVELLDDLDPQVMILMTGVNDLNSALPFGQIIGAIEDLIAEAQSRGVIVLLSTLPRQVEGGRKADAYLLIEPFNAELADVAEDEGIALIDIHPHLTEQYITPDGIHVTEAGDELLASLYFEALMTRFETPPTR